ncbi:MAG: glycosyltransferase [Vicingaceae bacterium]
MSRTKPTVLFLPKWYPHEAEPFDGNFIENHAHAIKKQAQICVLFVHSEEQSENHYRIEETENQGLVEVRVFFKKPTRPISFLNKIGTALRYAKAQKIGYEKLRSKGFQFDLCHVHVLSRPSLLALSLLKKEKIPFGITEHWSGYLKERNDYHGTLKKHFTKKAVSQAAFVTTVSSYLKKSMLQHGLQSDYHVIPNVVDPEIFQPSERNSNQVEVIYVGNLIQRPKRILDILAVFAELKKEGLDFVLRLYGEGSEEKDCRRYIEENELSTTLQLKGTADRVEIGRQIGKSAFLLLFSDFENQPCVISEAQACGIPVVVPDLPGIKEFMREELGLLFPTGDREAFKAACRKMLTNYTDYKRENIQAYALKTFGEAVIGKQFGELYHQTLADS